MVTSVAPEKVAITIRTEEAVGGNYHYCNNTYYCLDGGGRITPVVMEGAMTQVPNNREGK